MFKGLFLLAFDPSLNSCLPKPYLHHNGDPHGGEGKGTHTGTRRRGGKTGKVERNEGHRGGF